MRIGVIDLGTNTFNLLIAEQNGNGLSILCRTKGPVKLGEGGITKRQISDEAQERGLNILESHLKKVKIHAVDNLYAFATSAIRSADNGADYVKRIKKELDLDINVITGSKEAELIYRGVKRAVNITDKSLIVDIGGGSVEFIICDSNKILWKRSYKMGIARMLERFSPSDPINNAELKKINNYVTYKLITLFEELEKHKVKTLIGSSGSFDTFAKMIAAKNKAENYSNTGTSFTITVEEFEALHHVLLASTTQERKNMDGLELMRVEMIVLASILVDYIVKKMNLKRIIQSNYALKEGVVYSVINNLIS